MRPTDTIRNASFAITGVSGAGHTFVGNRLLDPNCARVVDGVPDCGTIVFGISARGPASKGDVFASNLIDVGGEKAQYPGSQGALVENWWYGNDFVGATDGEVFGRYSAYPQSEISIFSPAH